MTITIDRSCYITREEVMRALDVKLAGYSTQQVDRQVLMASETVEDTTKRFFYPIDGTKSFDWPNFQYAYPWRLWLDKWELAAQPTLVVTGTFLPNPVVIPTGNYICQPYNSGPPFTSLELRRDQNSSFGANSTPQLDISITGSFGYWAKTRSAGTLATALTATQTTIQVSEGDTPGVGDTIWVDSERILVQDKQPVSTGVALTSGATTASAADNSIVVPSGQVFAVGEVITVDSERMLIQSILGNTLMVKRSWDGTILTTHNAGTTIWADRMLTVARGINGTTAATHSNSAPISVSIYPGLIKELALAEAVIGLTQEPSAYAFDLESRTRVEQNVYGGTGHGQQREPAIGIGIQDLRDRTAARYGRQMRSRVI